MTLLTEAVENNARESRISAFLILPPTQNYIRDTHLRELKVVSAGISRTKQIYQIMLDLTPPSQFDQSLPSI